MQCPCVYGWAGFGLGWVGFGLGSGWLELDWDLVGFAFGLGLDLCLDWE